MELKNYLKFYFKSYYISYINISIKNIKFPIKNYIVIFNLFSGFIYENYILFYIFFFLMFYKNNKKIVIKKKFNNISVKLFFNFNYYSFFFLQKILLIFLPIIEFIYNYIKILKKDILIYKYMDVVLFNRNLIVFYEIQKLLKYDIISYNFIKAISININFLFINFISYISFFFVMRLLSFPIINK